jgi:glyoxylate reductase
MRTLVTGNLPEEVLGLIRREHEVEVHPENRPLERDRLLEMVRDKEGLLCMITDRVDEELLAAGSKLHMIANFGVGFDNIDVAAASRRNIPVSNTPGVLTDATADLTFALILAVARRMLEGDRIARAGAFRFWAPMHFLGHEVSGKTLGIVGLGRIGKALARRARGFDMKVLYHNRRRLTEEEERSLGVSYGDFATVLSHADFVSLHVPLTPDTHHLMGQKELTIMRPSAYLINTSRGPVVEEQALMEALKEGVIAGAGLDVYEKEPDLTPGLEEFDNVVLLPHIGSATIETRTKMGLMAAKNLLAGLRGRKPPDCLNWENVQTAMTGRKVPPTDTA